MSDLADLESIRKTIVDLAILIRDPRVPGSAKKRATKAIAETAVSAIDTALALLRAHQVGGDSEMLP